MRDTTNAPDLTAAEYARLLDAARERGARDGRNASEWYAQDAFGGRVTRGADAAAARILAGLDEGDPAILDDLPTPDLSGEWADRPTARDVYADILSAADVEPDDETDTNYADEALDAYETAYLDAVSDRVRELAAAQVAP